MVYNADGNCFRLHPGYKRSSDAQLIVWKTVVGAHEPDVCKGEPVEPASQAYRQPPEVYTQDYAATVPQGDRMGRMRMFAKLQMLPSDRPWELTHATIEEFPWWLWLPTIGGVSNKVIGVGIERVALMETWSTTGRPGGWDAARFLIAHTDKTAVLLNAAHGGKGHIPYWTQDLEKDSDNYNWWVNWRR